MKQLLLLLAAFTMLQSCNSSTTLEDTKIDAKLRETIYAKNESLIEAMISTDLNAYYSLESKEYSKQRKTSRKKPADYFKKGIFGNKFTVYDEFLVTNTDRYSENEVTSQKHGYTFTFRNDRLQSYVSVLKISGHQFDSLLAVTHGLDDNNEWKIYAIDLLTWAIGVKHLPIITCLRNKTKKTAF
jgi:hypothetical protein